MQYAMLIGPFQDNIWMDQSASFKNGVSIAATILLLGRSTNLSNWLL